MQALAEDAGAQRPWRLPDGTVPERVLVVRALPGVGDLLCAEPSWRALRAALPDARIDLLGVPAARPVVEHLPHFDGLVPFGGWPGVVESPTLDAWAMLTALGQVQASRYDLVVQQHGSGLRTNSLAALLGGRYTAGFFLPGQYRPDDVLFTPYPAGQPEPRRHLRLVEHLGIRARGEDLRWVRRPEDDEAAAALAPAEPYACVHAGASIDARRWPPDRFARVADRLADAGLQVLLTGSAAEKPTTAAVAAAMRAPAVDLAGRTSLGALAAVLGGSRLVVTNDTGASHLAAAVRVPSVVVFTASDPRRWAPLDGDLHRAVAPPAWYAAGPLPRACNSACRGVRSPCLGEGCLQAGIEPEPSCPPVADVLEAVDRQLHRHVEPAGSRRGTEP